MSDMNAPKELITITSEGIEVEWDKLKLAVAQKQKADEIERRASLYMPIIGSILFTTAILLVKFIAY